ncbi:MAG: cell wall-binding repeat-containing protein, partial [Microbacterium sp.]|nr:cell wall-binding repeat-containing protein [Microbacterium sp.]
MRRRRAGAILAGLVIVVAALVPVSAEGAVPSVTSLSGTDRYATSAAISAASFSPGVAVAYVASGAAFPDALSGAAGGRGAAPVLLTRTDDLPSSIAQELTRLAPRRIVVLGGTGTVSDTVVAALGAYTTGTVTRLAGADRYETSAAISLAAFPAGAPVAYLASGET